MTLPLFVGREGSVAAVDEALARDRYIFLATQRDPSVEDPKEGDLYRTGTVAMIMRMLKLPDGRLKILIQGVVKAKIVEFIEAKPAVRVRIDRIVESPMKEEVPRGGGADARFPGEDREDPVAQEHAGRDPDGHREHQQSRRARRPRGVEPAPEDRGGAIGARGGRPRREAEPGQQPPLPRAAAGGDAGEDPEPGEGGDVQEPAGIFPAGADEGDQAGAGRHRREVRGVRRPEGEGRGRRDARGGEKGGGEAAPPPGGDASRLGRVVRGAHLPRLDGGAPLEEGDEGQHPHRKGEGDPRRGPP